MCGKPRLNNNRKKKSKTEIAKQVHMHMLTSKEVHQIFPKKLHQRPIKKSLYPPDIFNFKTNCINYTLKNK